ncbi:MAG: high-potential iron-sulfur protein [Lysobacteraceae bacterium]
MPDRRTFLTYGVLAAVAPLAARGVVGDAPANDLPKLPLDHPQGKALAYVEDAATVKAPTFTPGSRCANCQFFTAADGACALFAGYRVDPEGWCSAWAKKA